MLTIEPEPAVSTIACAASWLIRNGWVTLNRMARSKNPSEVSIAGRGPVPPALLTSTSRRPNLSTADRHQPRPVLLDEDVGDHGQPAPSGLLDPRDDLVEVGPGARPDDDVRAGLGERDRDAAADPLPAAGDDGDLPVEPEPVEDAHPTVTEPGAARRGRR